jgi:autotransporter-associated beta strand protein
MLKEYWQRTRKIIKPDNFRYTCTNVWKLVTLLVIVIFYCNETINATTYYSRATGTWNTNSTWSLSSGGGSVGAGVFPIAGDVVIIERGFTVTVNSATAACASLQIGSTTNGAGTLNYTVTGNALTVSGLVQIGGWGNAGWTGTISFFNTSSLTAGSVILGGTGATPAPGTITMTAGSTLTAGSLAVGAAAGNTWTPSTGTIVLNSTNTLPATVFTTFNNLTINGGTTSLGATITSIGGTLTVSSGTFALSSFNVSSVTAVNMTGTTISGTTGILTLAGNITTNASATTSTISALIALGATRTFTVASSTAVPDMSITSIISGVGFGINKAGNGILNLSGASTYTGLTTINAGTIQLGAAGGATNTPLGTIGAGTTVIAGAALDLNGFTLGTSEALTLNGTGIAAGGSLTNSSVTSASYSGLITLGSTGVSIVANSGDINITNAGTINGATFGLTLGGSGNGSLSGILGTTSGTLTKSGTSTWTLSGANTYTGLTTISAGILKLGSSGSGANSPLGTIGAGTSVTAGGALDLNGFSLATSEALTLNGTGVSAGGALTNSSATAVNYSGLITLGSTGVSILTNSGDINITNAGTISGATFSLTLGGSGNGSLSSIIGNTSGTLTKSGTGSWTFSGINSYTGSTTISAGSLILGAAETNLTAVTVNGILDLHGTNQTIGSLAGSGTITSSTAGNPILTAGGDNSSTIFSGIIQNGSATSVGLTKAGTGTILISGNSTYTGITTIASGVLQLGVAGSGANGPLGTIGGITSVTSGAALDLNGFTLVTAEPLTLNGTGIAGSGALNNSSATSTNYSGLITLGSSGISIVANSGDINITNAGTISGGTFALTLGGSGNGSLSGILGTTTGTLTKSGTGTWTLSGANTYTGLTTIGAGTLRLGSAGSGANSPLGTIGSGTSVSVGGALDLNGFSLATSEALTLNGTGVLAGGALTNSSATAVNYSGLLTLGSTGVIILTNSGDINITNVGTISGATFALTLGGSGNGSITSIIGTTSGTLTKSGTGIWALSGASTYTGLTNISAGTLKLGASGGATNTPLGTTGAGTSVTAGASLDLNGFTLGTAEALTLNGTGISSGGALTNSSATQANYSGLITLGSTGVSIITNAGDLNITNAGTITGATFGLTLGGSGNGSIISIIGTTTGTLTKSGTGTWTLSGLNTFTGTTTINSGTLKLGAAETNMTALANNSIFDLGGFNQTIGSITGSGIVTSSVTGIQVLTSGGDNSTGSFSGSIQNGTATSIGLTKAGTGTFTLSGTNSYSGNTTISAGTLTLGTSNCLSISSQVTLNGGTLSSGASSGYSSTAGALGLTASSTITFGTGVHSLNFAASNGVAWTASTTIIINGWQGNFTNGTTGTAGKIFVGASSTGLTASQLAKILFYDGTNYYGSTQLSTGEVVPNGPQGFSSAATGNWNAPATWGLSGAAVAGLTYPGASNNAIINTGNTVTVNVTPAAAACNNLTITGTGVVRFTATGRTLNVGGNLVIASGGTINGSRTGIVNVTGTFNLASGNAANINRVTITINGATTIAGTLNFTSATGTKTFAGSITVSGSWANSGNQAIILQNGLTFNGTTFTSGTGIYTFNTRAQSIGGTKVFSITNLTITGVTLTNNSTLGLSVVTGLAGATGTLLQGTNAILNIGITGAMTLGTLNATTNTPNTVNYNRAGTQTIKATTYYNLTLSGTLAKTFPVGTTTINNILSMAGTTASATVTGTLTYGASAQLQYNKTVAFAAGAEWQTPFTATGGVVINNTGGTITLNAAKVFNAGIPLTINTGATLNTSAASNWALTFGGNFNNSGTFTANASPITITNTMVTQSISGFTTTGLVSMTKTAGIATFQGNVNGAGLTINGTGGTLNLGIGLTHTFTGIVTLTAGTLNGGSCTLNENMTSATAWNGIGSIFTAGTGTVVFGGAAQTFAATGTTTFNNLTFSGSAVKTILAGTTSTVNGILSMEGTATVTVSGTLSYGSNATLQYKSSTTSQTTGSEFPATFGGTGGVIINNTFGGGSVSLSGSHVITNGLTLTSGPFAVGANTLTLNGPTIAGTPALLSTLTTSSLVFGGSSVGVQIPGIVTVLNGLTINNLNGITLNSSPALSGSLTLTSGVLNTGIYTIKAVSDTRTTGWVNGKLSLNIPAGTPTVNIYIGDATNYTPVILVFAANVTGGAGYIIANSTAGQHPQITTAGINYSLDVARYFTLTNSGTTFTSTFSPTFNFVAGDVIGSANTNNFIIRRYNAGWTVATVGTKTGTSTQATAIPFASAFGDYAIGEAQSIDHFALGLASPQTNGITFTGTNTLTASDISGNPIAAFDASTDNVTISAVNPPLTAGAGAISGLSGGNKLTSSADFVIGVANLTSLGLKYTGATGTGTFTATSSVSGKTGTSGSEAINAGSLIISAISTQNDGVAFSVTITAKDYLGNPVNATSNSDVTLSLATGTGTLSGTLTGTILIGTNSVTISGVTYIKAESGVSITAAQISGTPGLTSGTSNTFTVNAGLPTHFSISAISSPQIAGAVFNITITSLDATNNPGNVTSDVGISLSKATGTGTLSGTFTGTIVNGTNNITISGVKYNLAESGVSITASQTSGTPVAITAGTSNTFLVVPYPVSSTLTPSSSSIIANGISTQVLTVQAKDASGINLSTGGSTITITQSSGTGTIGSVSDNGNGTYTAIVISPSVTGSGSFIASMNGNPVQSSTGSQTIANVNYIPGPVSAAHSTLSPITASIADDGIASQILTVQAIDANGNNLSIGGATVTIALSSGVGNINAVTDNTDGTYSATVTSTVAGSGVFVATIGGSPVMGGGGSQSASTITFTLGTSNATASVLTPINSTIVANGFSTQDLTVQVQDATGNNITSGGDVVTISKQSGTGTIGGVTDNGDGTYTATITSNNTASTSGIFIATLNGSAVKNGTGSQTQATVFYGSDAAQSTLTPTAASITGNGSTTIDLTLQAEDANGNNVIVGGETVTITKFAGTGTISGVTDNGDGTYTATVTSPASTGSGTFVATMNGAQVQNGTGSQTQAIITYAGPADATQSALTPTFTSTIADGLSIVILTVQANDASGNNLSTGGSTVTITQSSGTGSISVVTDNGDGTYDAVVTAPSSVGSGIFAAILGGSPVKSGGATQTQATISYITGPADASRSALTPINAIIVSCGSTQVLTVQAKDASGNNITTGGSAIVITLQSGTGSVGVVTDNGNGTYSATVTSPSPTSNGNGVFVATLGGNPIMSGTGSQTTSTITYTDGFLTSISGGVSPICASTNPGTFSASGVGGPGPITYLWYENGLSTGATNNTYNPGPLASTSSFYCAVSSGACGTINTSTTIITVNPLPSLIITNPSGVCSPSTVDLTTGAVTTGSTLLGGSLSYWTDAGTTLALGIPTAVPTSGIYYIKVTTGAGCTDIRPVTVTINPAPAITAMTSTICSGAGFTVTPVDIANGVVPPGTTYSWATPVVTGGLTGGTASSGFPANITGTLTNPTGVAQTATYTVTPTSGVSCSGTTFTVIITANPFPAAIGGSLNVCMVQTTNLTDATVGGLWNSANPAVATIDAFGVVSSVSLGTSVISYNLAGCAVIATITVNRTSVTGPVYRKTNE